MQHTVSSVRAGLCCPLARAFGTGNVPEQGGCCPSPASQRKRRANARLPRIEVSYSAAWFAPVDLVTGSPPSMPLRVPLDIHEGQDWAPTVWVPITPSKPLTWCLVLDEGRSD